MEKCKGCGKSFKRVSSHIPHCEGLQDSSSELNSKERFETHEICPKCKQSFKRLASHLPHCKGIISGEVSRMHAESQQKGASREETCPKCHQLFKRLVTHFPHCKGVPTEKPVSDGHDGSQRPSSKLPNSKCKPDEESCPQCHQTFKRLSSHLPYCKIESNEETCLKCNQSFKRLASHLPHCKGKEDEETCPLCSKTFIRLSSHLPHCERKLQVESCPKLRLDLRRTISQFDVKLDTESEFESETDAINHLKEVFLRELNGRGTPFHWSIFSAGSHYDRTKNTKIAGDYDFILYPDVKCKAEFCTQSTTLGYCKVTVCKDEPKFAEMKKLELIQEHNHFSPSKMKDYSFEKFDRIINDLNFRQSRRIYRLFRKQSSPAFTILYDVGAGIKLEVDLVPGLHFNGWPECNSIRMWKPKWNTSIDLAELKQEYFCVAREHPNADEVPDGQMLWRESFSHTEKLLWKHADGAREPPTCRKPVLKALKSLLSECRSDNTDIKHLSTFHLRTFMLHAFDNNPRDEDWDKRDMKTRLENSKKELKNVLNNKVLINYFVPGHNVLTEVPEKELDIFIAYINQSLSPKRIQQK